MKKKFLLFLAVFAFTVLLFGLLAVNTSAATYSGECGENGNNVTWTLDTNTGVLNIGGTGAMKGYGYDGVPWYSYHSSIKSVTIGKGVTSIGDYAFNDCYNLTSITIPTSVTSIGEFAFYYCTSLARITIPSSVTSISKGAFSCCYSLTSVTIPTSVTSIGDYAFYGCTCITSITIPSSVTSIGSSAFEDCDSLTSIEIPSSVTSIGVNPFAGCSSLASITVASGNTAYHAKDGCLIHSASKMLISICPNSVIPNNGSVVLIGSYAFAGREDLTSITIPSSVTSIGSSAFEDCDSLTSIEIPSSVTSIGGGAFWECTSLTSVHITDIAAWCNISFGSYSANPLYYAKNLYLNGTLITDLVIPSSVTSIGSSAFSNCDSLTSITIPTSVTSIGSYAFSNCDSLTSITIPTSVTSIGSYAFSNCTSLASVTFAEGSSLTSIGYYAFYKCTSLESITLPFVGATKDGTNNTHFGYIFGAYSYSNNSSYVPSSLKTVVITGGTSIGSSAFSWCTSLTSIEIPSSVTSIGYDAFYNCYSLTSITIPSSVTSIGTSAFECCASLESITLPFVGATKDGTSDTHFGYIFGALSCYYNSSYVPSSLKTVVITGGTSIGSNAFLGCTSLKSITILSSVTSIGDRAFSYCTSLGSVTFAEGSSLTSIGSYAFYNCTSLTSITIPSGVTSIGSYAFEGCSSLTSITLPFVGATKYGTSNTHFGYIFGASSYYHNSSYVPASLKTVVITGGTSIGSYAFSYCDSLTSITIPSSVTSIGNCAFFGCSSLESIEIPSGVTSIGNSAFEYCTSLTSITIPSSVTSIGSSAFENCTSLTSVTFGANSQLTSIGGSAFRGCTSLTSVTLGENSQLTSIDGHAFSDCTSLTSISIPSTVTSIGNWAFENCTRLTSVTFGENSQLTSIGNSAFEGCSSLTSVTFGANSQLTGIASYAFEGCSSLTSISIPSGVTSIGENPFAGCSSLASITVEAGNTVYHAKNNCLIHTQNKKLVAGCKNSVIPSDGSVTRIGREAFYGCTRLTSISIPSSVKIIDDRAFWDCTRLTSISIPSTVTSIGGNPFAGCSSLANITVAEGNTVYHAKDNCLIHTQNKKLVAGCKNSVIPSDGSVTSIGDYAFYGCSSLTSISIPSSVTSIGSYAFYDCTSLKVVYISSPTIASALRGYGSSTCGNLADSSYRVTFAIKSDITNVASYIKNNYTYVDTVTYLGEKYTVYSKHSHIAGSSVWQKYTDESVVGKCSSCGLLTDDLCAPLGHSMTPATCTVPSTCSRCGHTESEALGHDMLPATQTAPSTCSRCGHTEGDPIHIKEWDVSGADEEDSVIAKLYALANNKYKLVISGEGAMKNWSSSKSAPWQDYANRITEIVVKDGVTKVGNWAFYNTAIKSITLPESVTAVGGSAFRWCAKLESAILGNTESVGSYAFYKCGKLTSCVLVAEKLTIGNNAFLGCDLLAEIPESTPLIVWDISASGDGSLTASLYTLGVSTYRLVIAGDGVMKDWTSTNNAPWYEYHVGICEIEIKDGVKTVGNWAFYNTSIAKITIPDSVTKIGNSAFRWCALLEAADLGEGVESLGTYCFYHCERMTSCTSDAVMLSVGNRAFDACYVLSAIPEKLPVASWDVSANGDGSIKAELYAFKDGRYRLVISGNGEMKNWTSSSPAPWYEYRANIVELVIAEGITAIGNYAFYSIAVQTVILPDSVTKIGNSAFRFCALLESVTVGENLASIGTYCFYNCSKLIDCTLPEGTTVGNKAFDGTPLA